ncbi:MAG: STAS domain-containing protein [Gemmataceae bacterium]|nr:STAS domain-containing protein [Gemmataceae bacterium]
MPEAVIRLTPDPSRAGATRLVLAGRLGIDAAEELRRTALAAVERGGPVTACCAGVESLHAAAVQVLLGLGRELDQRAKPWAVTGGGAADDTLRLGGLIPSPDGR